MEEKLKEQIEKRKQQAKALRDRFIYDIVANHLLVRDYSRLIGDIDPKKSYTWDYKVPTSFSPIVAGSSRSREDFKCLEDLSVEEGEVTLKGRWNCRNVPGHSGMYIPSEYHFLQDVEVLYCGQKVYGESEYCFIQGLCGNSVNIPNAYEQNPKENLSLDINRYVPGKWEKTLPKMLSQSKSNALKLAHELKTKLQRCKGKVLAKQQREQTASRLAEEQDLKERFGL